MSNSVEGVKKTLMQMYAMWFSLVSYSRKRQVSDWLNLVKIIIMDPVMAVMKAEVHVGLGSGF